MSDKKELPTTTVKLLTGCTVSGEKHEEGTSITVTTRQASIMAKHNIVDDKHLINDGKVNNNG